MTSERDFDRIARAWLDLGPNEAPDRAVAAVLQAVETTPQVRRPIRWPTWRPTTMTRITLLAVLAGTIAIAIGGLVLVGGQDGPAPQPAPSTAPSPAAPTTKPLPEAIWGGWTAASRGTEIEDPDTTTILFGPSSLDQWNPGFGLERQGRPRLLGSTVVEETPGVLRITLNTPALVSCEMRDVGRYRWSLSGDGQWLTLEAIEDACPARSAIVTGTWQHNLGYSNEGGPGVAVNFAPYVAFTLPVERWNGNQFGETDTLVLDNGDGSADLRIWKDPDGFVDACDRDAGRLDLDPGTDAFLAYLRDGRQFSVIDETELTVDGRRAVEVEIRLGDAIEGPCAPLDGNESDRRGILLWASHAAQGTFWNGVAGDQWSLVVTEVDGATFLMEIVRQDGSSWPVDRSVVDSIRFVTELPTPPAS
ncbi:MAG TPA: hypothetical protein VIH00_09735 [Candidatus Limnocylindrales bacterium]